MPEPLVNEQTILEALRHLPGDQWAKVLAFIEALQHRGRGDRSGSAPDPGSEKRWTAAELLQLPLPAREAILAVQAALAEEEYRNNPDLTAVEAFGKDDLYVDSPDTETR